MFQACHIQTSLARANMRIFSEKNIVVNSLTLVLYTAKEYILAEVLQSKLIMIFVIR